MDVAEWDRFMADWRARVSWFVYRAEKRGETPASLRATALRQNQLGRYDIGGFHSDAADEMERRLASADVAA